MRLSRLLLAALLVAPLHTLVERPAAGGEATLFRVRLGAPDARQLARALEGRGYDVLGGSVTEATVDLVVSAAELERLRSEGFEPVLVERGRPFAAIQVEQQQAVPGGYLTLAEIEAQLARTAAAWPAIARLVDVTTELGIGPTVDGHHLLALKISDNVELDEDEPALLVVSAHHAREIVTPVLALDAIRRLTEGYGRDTRVTPLVDSYQIWIAPVWNPDGYEHVFQVDNLWRKNRRPFPGGVGVDLNRNYPFGWYASCAGSTNPASNNYKGPAVASEVETQTLLALEDGRRFAKVLDYHSSGREVVWGYRCLTHPWASFLEQEAAALSSASGYGGATVSPSAEGEHYQWPLSHMGSLSMLTETATEFQPSYAKALEEAQRVWPGLLYLLERPIGVWGHVRDACTGAPLVATIRYPDVSFSNGETNSSFRPFGRFHAFPPPGTHTMRFMAVGYEFLDRVVSVVPGAALELDVALTPYGGCCTPGSFTPRTRLMGVEDGAGGAAFQWDGELGAPFYHLNSLRDAAALQGELPKLPPVGLGTLECSASVPACTDPDAVPGTEPLLFYQVLSACGATGLDEGPAF